MTGRADAAAKIVNDRSMLPSADSAQGVGIPYWQVLTLIALALLNASWGIQVFRLTGGVHDGGSVRAAFIFLASTVFITYLIMITIAALRLTETVKRGAAGMLLFILIAFLPGILYPDMQAGFFVKLGRYLSSLLHLGFFVSPEFLNGLLVLYFWRLGLNLSGHWIGPLVVARSLRLSTLMMIVLGLAASSVDIAVPLIEMFVLLFSGMLAMGSARISSVGYLRGGRKIPFQMSLFTGLSISAAGLIVSVLSLSFIVSTPVAKVLSRIVSVIQLFFSWFIVAALSPVFIIFLSLVERLLERLKPVTRTMTVEIAPVINDIQTLLQDSAQATQPFPFADRIEEILGTIIPMLAIAVVLLIIFFILRRTRAARLWNNLNVEDREAIIGSFPEFLRSLMREGAVRDLDAFSKLMSVTRVIAAARVRQIYRRLLRQSAKLGKVRSEADTPLEFLLELRVVFPGCKRELEQITGAYMRVRYGEYPESREEVEAVELAWERVRKSGQSHSSTEIPS